MTSPAPLSSARLLTSDVDAPRARPRMHPVTPPCRTAPPRALQSRRAMRLSVRSGLSARHAEDHKAITPTRDDPRLSSTPTGPLRGRARSLTPRQCGRRVAPRSRSGNVHGSLPPSPCPLCNSAERRLVVHPLPNDPSESRVACVQPPGATISSPPQLWLWTGRLRGAGRPSSYISTRPSSAPSSNKRDVVANDTLPQWRTAHAVATHHRLLTIDSSASRVHKHARGRVATNPDESAWNMNPSRAWQSIPPHCCLYPSFEALGGGVNNVWGAEPPAGGEGPR